MPATLEDALASVAALQQADAKKFETMARDAADGNVPDPAELQRVLLSTGESLEEFRKMVRVFTKRNELRQNIIDVAEAESRLIELRAEIDQHNAVLEQHVAAHEAACRPIQSEMSQVRQIITSKAGADTELFNNCPSTELKFRFKGIRSRIESLQQAIDGEDHNLHRVLADVPHQPEGTYDFRLGKLRERIAELKEQMASAIAESNELAEAMRAY